MPVDATALDQFLAVVLQAAAVVLAVSGTAKLADPGPAAAALDGAGLPSSPALGRALGVVELVVGIVVLAVGGPWAAVALAVLYLGFVGFVVSNRLRGLHVPCGCIGEADEPPGAFHLVVDVAAAAAGVAAVVRPIGPVAERLDGGRGDLLALAAVVALAVLALIGIRASGRGGSGQ